MKTSITQIWLVCHLLPFAKVGQNGLGKNDLAQDVSSSNDC